jgi:hypothetical protein
LPSVVTLPSSSWPNLIERFFAEAGQRRRKRLAVTSVDESIAAVTAPHQPLESPLSG